MVVNAVAYIGDMDEGISKPKKILCDDGIFRVVKFNHPINFNRSLFNEFVGYKLAKLLDLPVLEQCLVNIPNDMAQVFQNVEGMTAGVKLGSPLTVIDKNIGRTGLFRDPPLKLYGSCINKNIVPGILTFDAWIHNSDRGSNHGNILVVPDHSGTKSMFLNDHGFAFFGPEASMQRYKLLSEFKDAHLTWQTHLYPSGPVYEALKYLIDFDVDPNPFVPHINNIESVTREQLEEIMNSLPEEWQTPDYEQKAAIDFLLDRKFCIKDLIDNLSRALWFPNGKGGNLNWQDSFASSQ